jgi:signal transduction histidine kinase
MDFHSHRFPFLLKLLLVLVFASIAVFTVFQYGWFNRAFESEAASTNRRLSNLVQKAGEQEFQKYGALIGSIDSVFQSAITDESGIKSALERLLQTWGPDGAIPGMISTVAYSKYGESVFHSPDENGDWNIFTASKNLGLPDSVNQSINDRNSVVYAAAIEGTEKDTHIVLFSPGGENPFLVLVVLNRDSFVETYLKPSVSELLTDYNISWSESPPSVRPFSPDPHDEKTVKLNPVRGLFGIDRDKFPDLEVTLPLFRGTFRSSDIPSERPLLTADLFRTFLLPNSGERDSPDRQTFPSQAFLTVTIKHKDGLSITAAIERNYSFYWLGTTGLMAILGALFLLLVVQINKTNSLHAQEREFVASVSHELRTPLTVIHSAAENIGAGFVQPDRLGDYGKLILEQTRRLERMVEEVLIFSQTNSIKSRHSALIPFSYQQVIADLKPALEALAQDNRLSLIWDTQTLPARVLGDPEAVGLIISNLVANAIYHAYPEGLEGQIRIIGKAAGASHLQIIVEDDGRGIPAAESRNVFLPFYRGKTSRESFEKGSGLGLFLTKKKIQILGGKITLASPYPRADAHKRPGCRFTVELPRIEESENAR